MNKNKYNTIKFRLLDILSMDVDTFTIHTDDILSVHVEPNGVTGLTFWDTDEGSERFIYVFQSYLRGWYDTDGVEQQDYDKLIIKLSVYAEKTKTRRALASLD